MNKCLVVVVVVPAVVPWVVFFSNNFDAKHDVMRRDKDADIGIKCMYSLLTL